MDRTRRPRAAVRIQSISDGQAALLIVGESKVQQAVDKAALKAEKHVAKELDVSAKDVDKAVQETAQEVS